MPMVGGTGEVREPDETVHDITQKIKNEAQAKTGLLFDEFTPVKYRSQLVNGVNYFIKVKHAPSDYSHYRVHKSFQGEVTLVAHQLGKKLEDDIDYFQ